MKPRHAWEHGLSSNAAAARLRRDGYNELPSSKPKSPFAIMLEVVQEPMFMLLLAAASIYLVLGDERDWQLIHEYPFVPELPAHAHVWQAPGHECLCRWDGPLRARFLDSRGASFGSGADRIGFHRKKNEQTRTSAR